MRFQVFKLSLVSLLFGFSVLSYAQECTHLWQHTMDIAPEFPKPMSGDTYAAYGLLGFYDKPGLRLEMHGQFHRGRFMSFESYRSKQKLKYDVVFDFQMEADPGSENPFLPEVEMSTPNRDYRISIVPRGVISPTSNTLLLSPKSKVHSIFYRAYVPSEGVVPTVNDLPRIFAFDSLTGEPMDCPIPINTVYDPGLITVALSFIREEKVLEFKEGNFWNGTNSAIPSYVHALSRVPHNAVSVIRFRAPTFTNTTSGVGPFTGEGEVRYWSFCIQNLKESETLGRTPDYLAKLGNNRFTTIVVGRGEAVKQKALAEGFNFLEDRREPSQVVMSYFYRNLLPHKDFKPYVGEYLPTGVVCSQEEFLEGNCQ